MVLSVETLITHNFEMKLVQRSLETARMRHTIFSIKSPRSSNACLQLKWVWTGWPTKIKLTISPGIHPHLRIYVNLNILIDIHRRVAYDRFTGHRGNTYWKRPSSEV